MNETETESIVSKTGFLSIVGNNWFRRGLAVALVPLVVTGFGGSLGGILREAETIQYLGEIIVSTGFMPVLIPFFTAFLIMTACGSQTMAGMTTAGLMVPLLPTLGISPVLCSIAIGTGTVSMNFFNNSGFWISSQMYGVNSKLSFRGITIPALLSSGFCMVILIALNFLNIV
jgi:GntP family gluconate:H+ symporter